MKRERRTAREVTREKCEHHEAPAYFGTDEYLNLLLDNRTFSSIFGIKVLRWEAHAANMSNSFFPDKQPLTERDCGEHKEEHHGGDCEICEDERAYL